MDTNFGYYLFVLAAIVVGIVIVKKVTGCLFRTVSLVVIVAVLYFVYRTFFQ